MFSSRRRRPALFVVVMIAVVASACSGSVSVDPGDPVARETTEEIHRGRPSEATDHDDEAAEPASTVAPVRSRGQRSTSELQDEYTSMDQVDFMNGFGYETGLDFGPPIATVTEGAHEHGQFGDDDYYWFGVSEIELGDLDGDGIDEAVVATTWNGGGTGYFDSVRAFRLVDGRVVQAGQVPFGDRADGGIHDLAITDGLVQVMAFAGNQGACCPNRVVEYRLAFDRWLTPADHGPIRSWMSLDSYGDLQELVFEPGTSSGVLTMYGGDTVGTFTFEARAGQVVEIDVVNGPEPDDITIIDLSTFDEFSALEEVVLPTDAVYEVMIRIDTDEAAKTTMVITIGDDGAGLPTLSWRPQAEQVEIATEPFVSSSVVWPRFSSEHPGVDGANAALAEFTTSLDDWWVEDVTELSEPRGDSTFDVSYEVTFGNDGDEEIVAVRFDYFDYVCCRPYPNYGHRTAVLDLVSGRLIPPEEILDFARLDEIIDVWHDRLVAEELAAEPDAFTGRQRPRFDSVGLVSGGIEFGTDRGSLAGGAPGTLVVLTFEELADLVLPEFLDRVSDR